MSDNDSSADQEQKVTQSQRLLQLYRANFGLVRNQDGNLFVVPRDERVPNVALPFGDLAAAMSRLYYDQNRKPPSNNAIQEAKKVIESHGPDADQIRIPMRFGRDDRDPFILYIDMGNVAGEAIRVTPAGWEVLPRSPHPFRRTEATRPMFDPRRAKRGSLNKLRPLFNVNDAAWDFLVAWMVTAWVDDFSHILLLLQGRPGSAKSTLARYLVELIDPSHGAHSGAYENVKDLISHATGSAVIGLENVRELPKGISDTLSRLVTGEAHRTRKYYTNSDVHITTLRRTIVINGIGIVGVRQDLRSRSVNVNLLPISDGRRREEDLDEAFEAAGPAAVRALLDILVLALQAARSGEHESRDLGRMASHQQWLYYVDVVRGTAAADAYRDNALFDERAGAEEDPVTVRLKTTLSTPEWIRQAGVGEGGAITMPVSDWLVLFADKPAHINGKDWPTTSHALTSELRNLEVGLKAAGWTVTEEWKRQRTYWTIALPAEDEAEGRELQA